MNMLRIGIARPFEIGDVEPNRQSTNEKQKNPKKILQTEKGV